MTHVVLENLCKNFGDFEAIYGIDLSIKKGEFCALLGPSGCGKSTLLRLIAGLEDVTSGAINIAGRDVTDLPAVQRQIAMVFQSYALYPHMTVAENIAFSLEVAGLSKTERRKQATEVAKLLQLDKLLDRKPGALSGGQRQRVAIGRALVRNPEVFLFDEPLSNLDALLRVEMRHELSSLHSKLGATMIYVTHDQIEAMTMADRIVVLNQGKIQQVGSPLELYSNPANRFVAGFIGSPAINFIQTEIQSVSNRHVQIKLGDTSIDIPTSETSVEVGARVELGIRPEFCSIVDPKTGHLSGTVKLVERLGLQTLAYVETAIGEVCVHSARYMSVSIGEKVGITVDADNGLIFGVNGDRY